MRTRISGLMYDVDRIRHIPDGFFTATLWNETWFGDKSWFVIIEKEWFKTCHKTDNAVGWDISNEDGTFIQSHQKEWGRVLGKKLLQEEKTRRRRISHLKSKPLSRLTIAEVEELGMVKLSV